MAYELIENKEKREATIRMYGVIGRDVDGNRMAYDIANLDKEADTIHILINSDGGSVSQGLSVVSSILSAKAYIHAHVNGIAASMAGVMFPFSSTPIAVSISGAMGHASMQDYAKLMIHDPHIPGMESEKLSAKDRKALNSIADTLRTILSRRGCDKDKITSLMKDETWFSALEAQSAGLCDDVVTTPRKEELSNLSVPELLSRINNEYQSSNKKTNMKEIAKALGLPEGASQQQILDDIAEKKKTANETREVLIGQLLSLGKKNGTVTDKNEDRMKRLANADFELFAEMISDVQDKEVDKQTEEDGEFTRKPAGQTENRRLSDVLDRVGKKEKKGGNDSHDWDWYQKHNPDALLKMEREDPERFNRLLDEYESSIA